MSANSPTPPPEPPGGIDPSESNSPISEDWGDTPPQVLPPTPPFLPPMPVTDPPPPPELSQEEQAAIDGAWEQAQRELTPNVAINENFTVRVLAGPATRGMTLNIAGEPLTLPEDAELNGMLVATTPRGIDNGISISEDTPPAEDDTGLEEITSLMEEGVSLGKTDAPTTKRVTGPAYIIIRNGEVALVSESTGEFQITNGERSTFEFLIDTLGMERFLVTE